MSTPLYYARDVAGNIVTRLTSTGTVDARFIFDGYGNPYQITADWNSFVPITEDQFLFGTHMWRYQHAGYDVGVRTLFPDTFRYMQVGWDGGYLVVLQNDSVVNNDDEGDWWDIARPPKTVPTCPSCDCYVKIKCATIPWLGWVGVHCWFETKIRKEESVNYPCINDCECHRYEVEKPLFGSEGIEYESGKHFTIRWGHVYKDLRGCDEDVGGGPAFSVKEENDCAKAKCVCENAPTYKHRDRYGFFSFLDPNSNSYVAYTAKKCGIDVKLPWRAQGRWRAD